VRVELVRSRSARVAIGEKSILRTKVGAISYPLRAVNAPRLAACVSVFVTTLRWMFQNRRYREGCL